MPTPPQALIDALRQSRAARHVFVTLDHSQGVVRAWDGVGERTFQGNTFLGVRGLGFVEGISQSRDVQNHSVDLKLNGVSLASMQVTDPDIRGRAATVACTWIYENNVELATRDMFVGVGDNLRSKITEATLELTARIKGAVIDWASAPLAFYTLRDQDKRYPGDTGFKFQKGLANATTNGWSVNVETSNSTISIRNYAAYDLVSGVVMGVTGYGPSMKRFAKPSGPLTSNTPWPYYVCGAGLVATHVLIEETTLAENNGLASDAELKFGGVAAYIDVAGVARTSSGKLVNPKTHGPPFTLRRAGAQADGVATAETIVVFSVNVSSYAHRNGADDALDGQTWHFLSRAGQGYSFSDLNVAGRIFDNTRGIMINASTASGPFSPGGTGTDTYAEAVTGTPVSIGAGKLRVGGVDCVLSTTGVVLSAAGRRIVRVGGVPATDYLRVWT